MGGGGPFYVDQGGSRILDENRVDQSGNDDVDVIDWVKADDFILAVNINSGGKDTEAAQYKLRWHDTANGGFVDVGAATTIRFGATDLVNGDPILVGGRKCDSQGGDDWANGEEVEGVASSDAIDLADEEETEIHFSLDCSAATDEHEYEFELYDDTLEVSRGTCGATITMEAGAETFFETPGQGSTAITGTLIKKSFKVGGAHAVAIAGVLAPIPIYVRAMGGYAMAIAGTLVNVPTYVRSIGGYAMAIVGSLARQTSKFPGGHSMTITGTLIKKSFKACGAHAIAIAGVLATATIYLVVAGGYAIVIAGSLLKKTSKTLGEYSTVITGVLSKKGFKGVGGYAIVITGSLSTITTFLNAVGGYAVTITGSLAKQVYKGVGGYAMTITGVLSTILIPGAIAVFRRGVLGLGMSIRRWR